MHNILSNRHIQAGETEHHIKDLYYHTSGSITLNYLKSLALYRISQCREKGHYLAFSVQVKCFLSGYENSVIMQIRRDTKTLLVWQKH